MKKIMVLVLILSFVLSAVGVSAVNPCEKPSNCDTYDELSGIPVLDVPGQIALCQDHCDPNNNAICEATATPIPSHPQGWVSVDCKNNGPTCTFDCKRAPGAATGGGVLISLENPTVNNLFSMTLFDPEGIVIDFGVFSFDDATDTFKFTFIITEFDEATGNLLDSEGNIIGSVTGPLDTSSVENFVAMQHPTSTGTGNFYVNALFTAALGANVMATEPFSPTEASIEGLTPNDFTGESGDPFLTLGITLESEPPEPPIPEFQNTGIVILVLLVAAGLVFVFMTKKKKTQEQ
ncbi:hypothetical protein KY331_01530 [Candidatus Woesearchaeota archaeon]|nr:hypothetical protein [Candidatus Woesearchaeota archaeon]